MNQLGLSSLVLLFILVLGIFILWETNEYIQNYTNPPAVTSDPNAGTGGTAPEPLCLSGEPGNCNDSDDVFILN